MGLGKEEITSGPVEDGGRARNVREDEAVGFMFPIYCWGIPPVMKRFMEARLRELGAGAYVWAVCTCGDEAGTAMRQFDRMVARARGRGADAVFSLIMPNTYVLLPGFDVDKPAVEEEKLKSAPARLGLIAEALSRRRTGVCDVQEGSAPALRSMIFPLFERWGVFPKKWHSTEACIGCGRCAHVCPARNISMDGKRPQWGSRCFSCCACYHVCPVNAVEYGGITKGKGQYRYFLKDSGGPR